MSWPEPLQQGIEEGAGDHHSPRPSPIPGGLTWTPHKETSSLKLGNIGIWFKRSLCDPVGRCPVLPGDDPAYLGSVNRDLVKDYYLCVMTAKRNLKALWYFVCTGNINSSFLATQEEHQIVMMVPFWLSIPQMQAATLPSGSLSRRRGDASCSVWWESQCIAVIQRQAGIPHLTCMDVKSLQNVWTVSGQKDCESK